jgi:3'-5' exoribonuclease
MKKKFIDTIRLGDVVDDIFVLAEKNLRQKQDGANFLNVALSDKTGRIKGVAWDNADRIAAAVNTDDFVRVRGGVSEYGGRLQLVIKDMEKCPRDAVTAADFIPATTRDVDAMFERLVKTGNHFLKAEHFKELLNAFWNDREFVRKFKTAPAAKKMHHAYIGGLLEHTLSMALLVEKISGHYGGVDTDPFYRRDSSRHRQGQRTGLSVQN